MPEAHLIVIQPWDRSALGAIEKAILKSDIGLTPNVDGTVVRLNIPPLTEERRQDLVKLVHKRMEEARVEIRNHRRDAADEIKHAEQRRATSAPTRRVASWSAQKLTDRWIDRGRPGRAGQGAGDPGGLMTSVEHLTDDPRPATTTRRRPPSRGRPGAPRTWRSSWTATGAGRASAACPRPRATPPASRPSGPIVERCAAAGIEVLSIYAFSRENWARDESRGARRSSPCSRRPSATRRPDLVRQGVRGPRSWAGSTSSPEPTRASIEDALAATAGGTRMTLNVAFNYSGRSEIVDAVRRCVRRRPRARRDRRGRPSRARLYTADLPGPGPAHPDRRRPAHQQLPAVAGGLRRALLLRPLWPDFGPATFDAALDEYARRSRRFGR